jgi:hypothetical protein
MHRLTPLILSLVLFLVSFVSSLSANPVKHLIVQNKGLPNMVAQHHTIEISFDGRVVWTELPSYNSSFREILGKTDSGYQRVVDSGIQNFSGTYKAGSIIAQIHDNAPPQTSHSVVAKCHNLKPIQGAFRNVSIIIDARKNCVIAEYNVDLP